MQSHTAAGGVLLLAASFLCAQESPQATFKTGAGEVLVDAVVRDKRGRLVRGLKAEDFTVLENNAPRKITSFVERRGPAAARPDLEPTVQAARPGESSTQIQRQIRLVSLVFNSLSFDARHLAHQAAQDFIDQDLGANVYYAVFHIGRGFRPILPYTNNREAIRRAISIASGIERGGSSSSPGIVVSNAPGPGPDFSSSMVAMADFNNRLDSDMTTAVSLFSIWGIIEELARLPGRKSILYFAEGLQLSPGYRQHYLSMISSADRANVTFYTIDARGLTLTNDQMNSNRQLQTAVATTQDVTTRPAGEGSGGYGAAELGMDKALASMYGNGQVMLDDLAGKTGGFLIANSNDLRKPMRRITEEFNTYYEITYRPPDSGYDGRFRSISVKVNRPDVIVQSREGYFALPPMEGQAVFPFEVPLLRALGRKPLPHDLNYRAGVLQFREKDGLRQASLVFDLPLSEIKFVPAEGPSQTRTHVSFLALIKDEKGQVVAKLSRDLPLNQPAGKVADFQQGRYIVTRPVQLLPGRYAVESCVADHEGGKFSANRIVLIVSTPVGGLDMSDVALLRRLDKLPDPQDPLDPLQVPAGRIVPTLLDSVHPPQLSAFFTIYPDPAAPAPQLYVDLLQDGKVALRRQPDLPAAPAGGAIPMLASLPVGSLTPGSYVLRVAIVQGNKAANRSMSVTIE
jgi:VWFA-related protein